MTQRSAGDIAQEATRLLRSYVQSGRTRTDVLKEVAALIVDLRAAHTLDDGRIDWAGRSPAYRAAMHEIYREAGVPKDRYDTVQAALRYHVGNLIRERATDEALEDVGLTSITPRERLAKNRDVVAALAASGTVAEIMGDPARILAQAAVLLEYTTAEALGALKGPERVAARRALTDLRDRVEILLPAVAPRSGAGGGAAKAV